MNNIDKPDDSGNDHGKICLCLEPYVHINIKNDNALLYNTLDGQLLAINDDPGVTALLRRMTEPRNLNAVIEDKAGLEESNIRAFLTAAETMQMLHRYNDGGTMENRKKPVAMPPILNFHRDRLTMARDPERDVGMDILKYLHKLNIYINCYHRDRYDNPVLRNGYKQFLFPYSAPDYCELKLAAIKKLLEQVKTLELCSVSILGGNIFQYGELEELVIFLSQLPLKKEFGVSVNDITPGNLERMNCETSGDVSFKIFVEPRFEKKALFNCLELLKRFGLKSTFQFVFQSDTDVNGLGEVIDSFEPGQLSVKAFFNGSNFNFLRENIFVEKSDLSEPVVSKKDIYARTVMNPNAFGNLTVLSCGDVHSNLNVPPIGTIETDVKQLLLNEMAEGNGWFRLRQDLAPCGNCIFHDVCPPISNYEYALSRGDLCWLHSGSGSE